MLRLYVTGKTSKAEVAIQNLRHICEQELRGQYELQVIDVLEHPQMAEDEKILATPTLIKRLPPPLRRVIGDLSDKEKVLLGLEVFRTWQRYPNATTTHEPGTGARRRSEARDGNRELRRNCQGRLAAESDDARPGTAGSGKTVFAVHF